MSPSLSERVPLPSSAPRCHRELPAASFWACKVSRAARAAPQMQGEGRKTCQRAGTSHSCGQEHLKELGLTQGNSAVSSLQGFQTHEPLG